LGRRCQIIDVRKCLTVNFEVNQLNVLKDIIHGISVVFPVGIVLATKNLFILPSFGYLFLITKKGGIIALFTFQ
jgi:hypothetical protein